MAQKRIAFKDLNLKDAFLFSAALGDLETCQLVLEIILGTKVKLRSVKAENSILFSSDARSVRLDIYADDGLLVEYDVEMQNGNEHNLGKRSRFHQAEMDLSSLKPGDDFNDLKPCYVIFICTFDPFGKGLYRYTFEERCLEYEMPLGDETKKIFLNTKGKNPDNVPEELVHFLNYVERSNDELAGTVQSPVLQELHSRIRALKKSREWEARYVTLGEYMDEEIKRGCQEAVAEVVAEVKLKTAELETKAAELETKAEEVETKAAEVETKAAEVETKAAEVETKAAEVETKAAEVEAKAVEVEAKITDASEKERNLMLTLTSHMIQDGKAEDVLLLQTDNIFLSNMMIKYNL